MEIARTRPMAVPAAGVDDVQPEPVDVKTLPAVPGVVRPVPPFAAGSVPVTPAVRLMLVIVLVAPLMVLFVSVSVLDAVAMLEGVNIADSTVMCYSVGLVSPTQSGLWGHSMVNRAS